MELATKERPHHHAGGQTPAFTHARHVKDMVSEVRYLCRLFSMLNCFRSFIFNFRDRFKAQISLPFIYLYVSHAEVQHFRIGRGKEYTFLTHFSILLDT